MGSEKTFEGVVDLVTREEIRFGGAAGEEVVRSAIADEELIARAKKSREELVEAVAEYDDAVLERYLAGEEIDVPALKGAIRKGTLALGITPVLCGAALRNKGVQPLLDAVCDYLPSPEDIGMVAGTHPRTGKKVERKLAVQEPALALAFKMVADPHGDLAYLRLYSGKLKSGEQVWNSRTEKRERLQKIFLMHANHREQVEVAEAGNIVAVIGLKETVTGDTLAEPSHPLLLEPPRFPDTVVTMAIEPVSTADRDKLLESLSKLEREDPTFRWRLEKETGQVVISGMGELHLEVLKERLLREFRVAAVVGTPRVSYRQTIRRPAIGRGVFEKQLGGKSHFAAVVVALTPASEAARPTLTSELKKEKLPLEFHPAVEDGTRSALASGGVLGFPLTQLAVRIVEAEFRPGEASAVAYSAAASAAFANALADAGTTILEPVMRFEIEVPDDYYGAVSSDLNKRRAQIREVELEQGLRLIRGIVPLAEVFGYPNNLRSLSQGRGSISLEPECYLPVPEDVAARFDL
jgi:elongation factor G